MIVRKFIFWIHLVAGLAAGIVIAIMSVTGIGIAFEEEILRWHDRKVSRIEGAPGTVAKPLVELVQKVETARPGFNSDAISKFSDPRRAWEFSSGDELLYVDPFTGTMQETQSGAAHEVIHKLEEWHRWLGAEDELASTGRRITGVGNLALVVLCVTGLYLWFPRKWSRRAAEPLLSLKASYKGKAKHFNRHNVFGFWSLPVLLLLAVTGVVISFEWGHRLVFTVAGEEAPESRNYGMMAVPPPVVRVPAAGTPRLSPDASFEKVAEAFPEWQSITLELAADTDEAAPLAFGVTVPDSMPSRAYIPVKSDPFTGEILQAVRFEDRSPGLQARVWIRFLHTGGAFGLPGKIVATLATAASLVLVWTGFALSWRRFSGKRRQPSSDHSPTP